MVYLLSSGHLMSVDYTFLSTEAGKEGMSLSIFAVQDL